jgi:adenosine deaminase
MQMEDHSSIFIKAIQLSDEVLLATIPKSDLHNHGPLGSHKHDFEKAMGLSLPAVPEQMNNIAELDNYLFTVLRPHILQLKGLEIALRLAFRQALKDGVKKLEMSVDCTLATLFPDKEKGLIKLLQQIHNEEADGIQYIPEVGMSRNPEVVAMESLISACIESGYFHSIDLYGDELARDAKHYIPIYKLAKQKGFKLKSHAGEFGDAASVRYTVETLELDEIQHGIAAAQSPEVMKWLRNNNIRLNVCPSSNIRLGRAVSMETHPIRILADNGINVSINTDDIFFFGQSVSDEYMNLFRADVFSAYELNILRENALK